jgi:hypothetical protein
MRNAFLGTALSLSLVAQAVLVGSVALAEGLPPADQSVISAPSGANSSDTSVESSQNGDVNNTNTVAAHPVNADPAADVSKVESAGLMGTYADGKFHAEKTVTRAQLASVLVRTFKLNNRPVKESDVVLKDVPESYWAAKDIETAVSRGLMEGYHNNGYFYPEQQVTRGEAFAIFAQAYGVQQLDVNSVESVLSQYPDAPQIPAWARKAMATSLKNGFVDAEPRGRIRPQQPMTRGDMAFSLSRYLDRLYETEQKML